MGISIELKRADREMILSLEKELIELIQYSQEVNSLYAMSGMDSPLQRYASLIQYFGENKAEICFAFVNNALAGYTWFFKKNDFRVHLNEIAVFEKYQSLGIGSKMINFVEEYARECGCVEIELFCREKNNNAKMFYSKRDYIAESRLMVKRIGE